MKAHHTLAHGESLVERDDPARCPLCGETFASVPGMRAHHKVVHAESISESRSLTRSVRQRVIERDEHTCQRCGIDVSERGTDGPNFEIHHLIPFAAGGPNHPKNLVTLCLDCHSKAHKEVREIATERPEILEGLRSIVCGSSTSDRANHDRNP
ncbi:HNH endonuclease [Halorubrum sp. F4]|uniref:HNH endonuclease n=1 Tax=Halorubrum sp. F4 TaxID=2989715 RepID=UPI0024806A6C|nr:HNH endonuclease [Halorubrum sp. F4]